MKLISWNVNGLRAVLKKNFLKFIEAERPDILCLQEIKCTAEDIEHLWPPNYATYWNCATRKGYSGTAIFTKIAPAKVSSGVDILEHGHGLVPSWSCSRLVIAEQGPRRGTGPNQWWSRWLPS